jgi:hypothetical protein
MARDPKRKVVATHSMSRIDVKRPFPTHNGGRLGWEKRRRRLNAKSTPAAATRPRSRPALGGARYRRSSRAAGRHRPKAVSLALSHRPFLPLITCLTVGLGFNKFNGLASRQDATRSLFLPDVTMPWASLALCPSLSRERDRRPKVISPVGRPWRDRPLRLRRSKGRCRNTLGATSPG